MNPVLLLHGALGSKSQLDTLKHLLENKGRSVYSLNFSGHSGAPFRNSFGIESFTEDVVNFMDAEDITQADIFGYSMGGYVALWLAHKKPARVGKITVLGTKFDWSVESAAREVKKVNPEKILEKVPAFARVLEHRHHPNDWRVLLGKTGDMMSMLGSNPLLSPQILSSIQHPVNVLLGDHDDMADRDYSIEVADLLPHGKFVLLQETHHPIERVNLDQIAKYLV